MFSLVRWGEAGVYPRRSRLYHFADASGLWQENYSKFSEHWSSIPERLSDANRCVDANRYHPRSYGLPSTLAKGASLLPLPVCSPCERHASLLFIPDQQKPFPSGGNPIKCQPQSLRPNVAATHRLFGCHPLFRSVCPRLFARRTTRFHLHGSRSRDAGSQLSRWRTKAGQPTAIWAIGATQPRKRFFNSSGCNLN